MEFTELRIFASLGAGQAPGPESSLLKCRGTELQQAISEIMLKSRARRPIRKCRTPGSGRTRLAGARMGGAGRAYYFNLRKAAIYAGSNEIQRNIMAKAVLGL